MKLDMFFFNPLAIKQYKAHDAPFKHFTFSNFFSPSLLKEIKTFFNKNYFIPLPHPDALKKDGTSSREYVVLNKQHLFAGSKLEKFIKNKLTAPKNLELINSLCSPATPLAHDNYDLQTILYKDQNDYYIKPHRDSTDKIVTMMVYFDFERNLPTNIGTEFYKGYKGGKFEILRKNDFIHNTGFGFARSGKSWHGVSQVSIPEGTTRKSIAFTFFKKSEFLN